MQRVKEQIGANWEHWEDWMGRPVTVGVLDTGLARHPDLQGKTMDFHDFVSQRNLIYDNNGHGTHICGIICGSGASSGGKFSGLAPSGRLVMGKVLDENGDGMTQQMLEGMEWILENQSRYQIRILNLSVGIGSLNDPDKEQALKEMVERLWDNGIVVVCAAGNKGPADNSISSVGGSEKVITVGCHDGVYSKGSPHSCDAYSGRGPFAAPYRKPDIVAPGTDIVSCNAFFQRRYNHLYHPYTLKSGTSMATSIVSGALALLLQKHPGLDPEAAKRRLTYTATDLGEPWNKQGWGMVNVAKLLED